MEDERDQTPSSGDVLRHNIKRIREGQRLSYVELNERLVEVGRPIPVLGLRRIERGERRVDADELMALAYTLGVMPIDLLVPNDAPVDAPYGVTPQVETTIATARDWISGVGFLTPPQGPADLATAMPWMPRDRATELTRKWWPGWQADWLREEHRKLKGEDPDGGSDQED